MYMTYMKELKKNKQIRIKYTEKNNDGWEDPGWWSEELWRYDSELDLYKCYYPVSTYEKSYYTLHEEIEAKLAFQEAIYDSNRPNGKDLVSDIIVEDYNPLDTALTVRELALEKMKAMSDEEIKRLFSIKTEDLIENYKEPDL